MLENMAISKEASFSEKYLCRVFEIAYQDKKGRQSIGSYKIAKGSHDGCHDVKVGQQDSAQAAYCNAAQAHKRPGTPAAHGAHAFNAPASALCPVNMPAVRQIARGSHDDCQDVNVGHQDGVQAADCDAAQAKKHPCTPAAHATHAFDASASSTSEAVLDVVRNILRAPGSL